MPRESLRNRLTTARLHGKLSWSWCCSQQNEVIGDRKQKKNKIERSHEFRTTQTWWVPVTALRPTSTCRPPVPPSASRPRHCQPKRHRTHRQSRVQAATVWLRNKQVRRAWREAEAVRHATMSWGGAARVTYWWMKVERTEGIGKRAGVPPHVAQSAGQAR